MQLAIIALRLVFRQGKHERYCCFSSISGIIVVLDQVLSLVPHIGHLLGAGENGCARFPGPAEVVSVDLVGEADLPSRQLVLQSFESPIVLCTTFRFAAYDDERPATASPLASQSPHNNHGDDAIRIPHQFQVEREISCDANSAQQSTVMLLLQQLKEGNTQDDPAECSRPRRRQSDLHPDPCTAQQNSRTALHFGGTQPLCCHTLRGSIINTSNPRYSTPRT